MKASQPVHDEEHSVCPRRVIKTLIVLWQLSPYFLLLGISSQAPVQPAGCVQSGSVSPDSGERGLLEVHSGGEATCRGSSALHGAGHALSRVFIGDGELAHPPLGVLRAGRHCFSCLKNSGSPPAANQSPLCLFHED